MTVSILRERLNLLRKPPRDAPVSLNRQLFQLAWPSLVENLLQTMLGVVDLIFVGKLGADAIAGVGLGNQLMYTLVVAFFGLAVGNTALVARAVGARDKVEAQRVAKQALILAALSSVVVAVLGYVMGDTVIAWMGATPEVTKLGGAFLRITSIFAVFLAIMVIGGGTLRGAGDTRTPMLITGTINFINIFLDYGLIFGNLGFPRLGAIGSAYATSTARAIGAALVLYALFKRGSIIKLDWRRGWAIRKSTIARILNIGWPSAAEQIIFQLGFLTFSAIVVGLGTADLAAMQIAFNIAGFSILPAFAFGVAALTLVGQSLGAGDIPRAEVVAKQALKSGVIWMSLMGGVFFVWRRELFGLYTGDETVVALGGMIMVFIALMQPLQAVAVVLASALRGAGDTRATMVITTVGVWIVRVGVGYLLGIRLGLGLFGVWLGWCADFMTRATLVILRYRAGRWKRLRV
jgi:putative MATE family efflux protein